MCAEYLRVSLFARHSLTGRHEAEKRRHTSASGREEGGDAAPRATDPLGQRALRTQLDGDLAREVLLLEHLVGAEVAQDQPVDLPRLGQDAQAALALDAGIVGHGREGVQVVLAPPVQGGDEGLRDAAEAEARGEDGRAGLDVCHGAVGVGE